MVRRAVLAFLLCCLTLPAMLSAQSIPYTEGSVWGMNLLRIKSGRGDDYYNDVRASLKRQLDEAKRKANYGEQDRQYFHRNDESHHSKDQSDNDH